MTTTSETAPDAQTISQLLGGTLDRLSFSAGSKPRQSEDEHRADHDPAAPSATLGELLTALDERAFGLMLLLLALPCCIPFLWGIPQIVALPMLALTAQLAMGRHHPWLPNTLEKRSFEIDNMRTVVRRSERYLGWVERISHPRLQFLTEGRLLQVIAVLLLIPTASILVPLPSTNTVPGIGVAVASVGLIERDGLLVLLGLIIGLVWVAALVFLGAEAISLFKAWLLGSG